MNKMKKSMKNKAKHDKNNVNTVPYSLRNKPGSEIIDKNINQKDVKKTKHERISRKSPGINRETPVKKPRVLSTKIRQRTKKLNNVSTPKSRPSRIKKTNEATVKTNESIAKTRESKGKTNESTEKIKSMFKIKECSVVLTQLAMKTTATQIPKLPIKNTPRIELSKRLEKLKADRKQTKTVDNDLINNKINPTEKQNTVKETATPENKTLLTASNKSLRPTRVLRKRHIIPNKYKDCSLNSPLITKNQKPRSPNPLAIYEFEFDPAEEPTKEKKESESSDDDNDSMKIVLNKLRRRHKKVENKKTKTTLKSKRVAEKQKIEDQKQKRLEQEEKQKTNEGEIKHAFVEENHEIEKQKIEDQKQKRLEQEEKQKTNEGEIKHALLEENHEIEKQKIEDQKQKTLEQEEKQKTNEGETKHACVEENREIKPKQTDEKQNKTAEENIPVNSVSSVETVSLSDLSDPVSPVDPSVQARNIVNEVTKSFIEDLSDEEINEGSPGRINVISNVVLKNSRVDKRKNKIFNSTTINSKPSQPWRINVSAIKKRPEFFSYKDKSFTPSYDREIITINDTTISKQNNTNISKTNNTQSDKLDKNKQISQTSILDFVKNSKRPKIPEIKVGLFNDLINKSPRKVLSEINFIQSTPLKPRTNLNILKSPNISIISPKKKKDCMFGFSYYSDDENKENFRKSPRKIKFKPPNPFDDITKQAVPKISTIQEKNNEILKDSTICDKEKSVSPIDTEITAGLFQDNQLEVSKKSTRTYMTKHPKRKRYASFASNPSDDELEPEKPDRKKQKNVQTKEEEKEANRLASHYNSMFEEIENYPLIIE